jgi:hypothetical protein
MAEDRCGAFGFDPMRRVKVVALLEHFEREVTKDFARSLGLARIVGRAVPAAEHEQDRLRERAQSVEVRAQLGCQAKHALIYQRHD